MSMNTNEMNAATVFWLCVLVVPSAIWVGVDSAKREWEDGSSTAAWVLGTLLLWIVVFPWYLVKRGRVPLKEAARSSQTVTRASPSSSQPSVWKKEVSFRRRPSTWFAVAAAGGMAIGALGPWASVLTISVSGLDTDDGPYILLGALLAALGVLLHAHGKGRGWLGLSMLCGVIAFAASLYDRSHLTHVTSDSAGLVRVGWGLNLTVLASALVAPR